jgi:lipopolysaccharide transport system ATP-binding protein
MTTDRSAVRILGLSKAYRVPIARERHVTLAEAMVHRLRSPLRRNDAQTFWALRDLALDIPAGKVTGIIGRNGAGKSTLLKVLSRITPPTTGRIEVNGRIGSLLEVGTGFHPELTGRENVFLNGTILGMRTREIERVFDQIVDYAGVSRFIDTPVKRYSSGMYVRLAFAVAAHLPAEILLLDEVLAVGDQDFQAQTGGAMRSAADSGRTIVLVSHQMQTILSVADEVVAMEGGQVVRTGNPRDVVKWYQDRRVAIAAAGDIGRHFGSGEWRIETVTPRSVAFACAEEKVLQLEIRRHDPHAPAVTVSIEITDDNGVKVAHCDSRLSEPLQLRGDQHLVSFRLSHPWLKPGRYTVNAFLCSAAIVHGWEGACTFEVEPIFPYGGGVPEEAIVNSPVLSSFEYKLES